MEITLFTDSVRCIACNQFDMVRGLKKRNDRWYCRNCAESYAPAMLNA